MNKTAIFVLGADRVGKSTFVAKLRHKLIDNGIGIVQDFHFDGPKPHHNSPIEQYTTPLNGYLNTIAKPDNELPPDRYNYYALCDRGGAEVCFYEKFRRHTDVDMSWAQCFESWVDNSFTEFHTVLIHQPWAVVKNRHLDEIIEAYPHSTRFWQKNKLDERKAEHEAYYQYMYTYLEDHSLCPSISYLCDNEPETISEFFEAVILDGTAGIDLRV